MLLSVQLLLVPFALALIANSVDQAINNRTLYESWMWHMPTLAIWILYLPFLSVLIALGTLAAFLVQRAKTQHTSLLKQSLDIYRNWPLVTVGLAGLFILAVVFGRDSVHCVMGNPFHEVQYWHQTWRCIQRG
jgi:hypothetical protein